MAHAPSMGAQSRLKGCVADSKPHVCVLQTTSKGGYNTTDDRRTLSLSQSSETKKVYKKT